MHVVHFDQVHTQCVNPAALFLKLDFEPGQLSTVDFKTQ